jgi:UDP-N-acetylglucosamine--N-acetylmuramyl-(pentapeptide) pyrophosphoryl-undecaprenol N-acetylglucosamine transferase
VPEAGLTPEALSARILGLMSEPERALAMSLAALRHGRPDAAERLADLVERLSQGEKETGG